MTSCGDCQDNCNPPILKDVEPCREPLDCKPLPCCSHCLMPKFIELHPSWGCDETAKLKACWALVQAELLVGGLLQAGQREMGIMMGALHLLTIQEQAELQRRSAFTSWALGEPIPQQGNVGDFWRLTQWGSIVEHLLNANPRLGFMMV